MTKDAQSIVLLVEDQLPFAVTCQALLKKEPVTFTHVKTGNAALEFLEQTIPSAILLDLGLPDMNGMEILKHVTNEKLGSPVIVMTAQNAVDIVVEAMRCGAFDFLEKPFQPNRLIVTLRNALHQQKLSKQVNFYQEKLFRKQYHRFIGACEAMQTIYRIIENVATSKASVFITGESGTGKELCAEAIHKESQRKNQPFVPLNCAAIPANLIESHLFGHIKGAFTGAEKGREGAASLANGGTLFLDEIGELDLNLQSKLLRFLQTGTIQKVGSDNLEKVDIRFICATNRDPEVEIEAGRFREDLYYRLNVIPIRLPPLHKRDDDVLLVAEHFLKHYAKEENKSFVKLTPKTEQILKCYNWPGNIRQLQNVIQNIVVLNDGLEVTPEMLPPPLNKLSTFPSNEPCSQLKKRQSAKFQSKPKVEKSSFQARPFWQIEKEAIEKTLDFCEGDIVKAAAMLEIHSSTIYRKRRIWKEKMEEMEEME
jgi:two-component system, repressor protein LuxO